MKSLASVLTRATLAAILAGAFGCAEEAVEVAPIGMKVGALSTCGGGAEDPFTSIDSLRVVVRHEGAGAPTFDQTVAYGQGASVGVEDVPEGTNEQVTLVGSVGGKESWFARESGQLIVAGRDQPMTMILSKLGGYSCPKTASSFTHRLFPTTTELGGGKYLITGGLTGVDTSNGVRYTATDASKRAFVYDSDTGTLTELPSGMNQARGAAAAVFVEGQTTNRVIIFGGATSLAFDAASANGFPWSFGTTDDTGTLTLDEALATVEVFEYAADADPSTGTFRTDVGAKTLLAPRVFPSANVISPDGLVLVCGGGPWNGPQPKEYRTCDVWDTDDGAFLEDGKSNNFPLQYRAGGSVLAYQKGEVTRLILVGGVTQGPVIELYRSSTTQRDGAGGTFVYPSSIPNEVPHQFFQSLTHIGGNRFAMIGGVNWNGGSFDPPSPAAAYVLTVNENEDGSVAIGADGLGGLDVGRYFHGAASPATERLTVFGGFTGTDLSPTNSVVHLQYNADGSIAGLLAPQDEEAFAARGGMGSLLMDNDTVLVVGGIEAQSDLETEQAGALQVYSPSSLTPLY